MSYGTQHKVKADMRWMVLWYTDCIFSKGYHFKSINFYCLVNSAYTLCQQNYTINLEKEKVERINKKTQTKGAIRARGTCPIISVY